MPLLPGTCYIEFVRVLVLALYGPVLYSLGDIAFESIMFLDDDAALVGAPLVRLHICRSTGALSITSRNNQSVWTMHADMRLRLRKGSTSTGLLDVPKFLSRSYESVVGASFYAATGNDYRGEFQALNEGWVADTSYLALVEYEHGEVERVHLRACAFLDACNHAGLWWQEHQRRPHFASSVGAYHVNSSDRADNRVSMCVKYRFV